ncbi:MAG: hypothetical protein AVDCRST_MAG41-1411, partial [uncultured Corynebacteriales bacterium]
GGRADAAAQVPAAALAAVGRRAGRRRPRRGIPRPPAARRGPRGAGRPLRRTPGVPGGRRRPAGPVGRRVRRADPVGAAGRQPAEPLHAGADRHHVARGQPHRPRRRGHRRRAAVQAADGGRGERPGRGVRLDRAGRRVGDRAQRAAVDGPGRLHPAARLRPALHHRGRGRGAAGGRRGGRGGPADPRPGVLGAAGPRGRPPDPEAVRGHRRGVRPQRRDAAGGAVPGPRDADPGHRLGRAELAAGRRVAVGLRRRVRLRAGPGRADRLLRAGQRGGRAAGDPGRPGAGRGRAGADDRRLRRPVRDRRAGRRVVPAGQLLAADPGRRAGVPVAALGPGAPAGALVRAAAPL